VARFFFTATGAAVVAAPDADAADVSFTVDAASFFLRRGREKWKLREE